MAALAEFVTEYPPSSVREDRLSLSGLAPPVVLRLTVPMGDQELIAFSSENKLFRIERSADGELEIMSPVGYDGSKREMFAGAKLFEWTKEHGGVSLGANTGFRLASSEVRSPDAAWISTDREQSLSREQRRGFVPFCPEFLIEVLPESDSRRVLESKMMLWIENGAQLAWMIDPFAAEAVVYRPGVAPELLHRPEWVEANEVVVGFQLEMERLWAK